MCTEDWAECEAILVLGVVCNAERQCCQYTNVVSLRMGCNALTCRSVLWRAVCSCVHHVQEVFRSVCVLLYLHFHHWVQSSRELRCKEWGVCWTRLPLLSPPPVAWGSHKREEKARRDAGCDPGTEEGTGCCHTEMNRVTSTSFCTVSLPGIMWLFLQYNWHYTLAETPQDSELYKECRTSLRIQYTSMMCHTGTAMA